MTENRKHKKSNATRRQFLGAAAGLAAVGTLAFSALAFGSEEDEAEQCMTYASKNELDKRKKIIAKILSLSDPAEVAAWITGRGEAPEAIKKEMDLQVNCLADAAAAGTGSADSDPKVSWRRDAATQRQIWDRKYDFLRKDNGGAGTFGIITEKSRNRFGDKLGDAKQWDPDNDQHRECWSSLTSEERQEEILQTSTAPGVSRHHSGADVDLFSTTPSDWTDDGPMADKYTWLRQNAAHHGFIQSYTAESAKNHPAISEERWHWSYYPVSEAILDFIRDNTEAITDQLETLWSYDPKRYTYVKENWQNYVFHVDESVNAN